MSDNRISITSHVAALGGVGAAFAAAFCCIGTPLAAVGLVGAAVIAAAEPLRPVFLLLAAALLVFVFRVNRKHRGGDQAASDPS